MVEVGYCVITAGSSYVSFSYLPVNQVQIKVVRTKLSQRVIENTFDSFWRMKAVPKLCGIVVISNTSQKSVSTRHTLDVNQMSSRGTELSLMASPTACSF
jgi:hypothetical protein